MSGNETLFRSCGSSENLRTQFNALLADLVTRSSGDGILTTPVIAVGSGATTPGHDAFECRVNGVSYHKAAADVALTATTHDIASHATDFERTYDFSVDAAGAVIITAGAVAAVGASVRGVTPAGNLPIGKLVLVGITNTLFDATTHDIDGAQTTSATYSDDAVEAPTALALTD